MAEAHPESAGERGRRLARALGKRAPHVGHLRGVRLHALRRLRRRLRGALERRVGLQRLGRELLGALQRSLGARPPRRIAARGRGRLRCNARDGALAATVSKKAQQERAGHCALRDALAYGASTGGMRMCSERARARRTAHAKTRERCAARTSGAAAPVERARCTRRGPPNVPKPNEPRGSAPGGSICAALSAKTARARVLGATCDRRDAGRYGACGRRASDCTHPFGRGRTDVPSLLAL